MESYGAAWLELDVRSKDSLHQAEILFDMLCQNRGSLERPDAIDSLDFSKVLGAFRDIADGAGCFVTGSTCDSPSNSECGFDEVGREEFLGAMREVYAIVGGRVFDAAIGAQTRLAAACAPATPLRVGDPADPAKGSACGGSAERRGSSISRADIHTQDSETTIPECSLRESCTPISAEGSAVQTELMVSPLYQRRSWGRTMSPRFDIESEEPGADVADEDGSLLSIPSCNVVPIELTPQARPDGSKGSTSESIEEVKAGPSIIKSPAQRRSPTKMKSWLTVNTPMNSPGAPGRVGSLESPPNPNLLAPPVPWDWDQTSVASGESGIEKKERRRQTKRGLAEMAVAAPMLPGQIYSRATSTSIDRPESAYSIVAKRRHSVAVHGWRAADSAWSGPDNGGARCHNLSGAGPSTPAGAGVTTSLADALFTDSSGTPVQFLETPPRILERAVAPSNLATPTSPSRHGSKRTPRSPAMSNDAEAAFGAPREIPVQCATIDEVPTYSVRVSPPVESLNLMGPDAGFSRRVSPATPSSARCGSDTNSHVDEWRLPEETLIVFDWDDTICPTSFIQEDRRLHWSEMAPCFSDPSVPLIDPDDDYGGSNKGLGATFASVDAVGLTMADALRRHVEVAEAALRCADACGRVVIITLAKQGWIELSLQHFLPGLDKVIEELGIQLIYARHSLPQWKVSMAALDGMDVFLLMKQAAMERELRHFYSGRPGKSWKNALSIGDSITERDALVEVLFRRSQLDKDREEKPCRCKTVKLPGDPDVTQLTAELEVLTHWLQSIVTYDGDISLDLSNLDAALEMLEKIGRQPAADSFGEAETDAAGFGRLSHAVCQEVGVSNDSYISPRSLCGSSVEEHAADENRLYTADTADTWCT